MTEHIAAGPDWEDLFDLLVSKKGVALIIGETDSGKSTLARYLTGRLLTVGTTVALLDTDIGQSSLGLPGTISMKVFREEKNFRKFWYEKMSFVGTANPAMVIPMIIKTSERMVDLCRKTSDITLVDTTGLVRGRLGKALKSGKIRRIKPDHIIAVCSGDELEHILGPLRTYNICRIRKAMDIKPRSRTARARYRQGRLQNYFAQVPLFRHVMSERDAAFFYRSRPFGPEDNAPRGAIAGLNRSRDTIGLSIVILRQEGTLTFMSPIKSTKEINTIILGDITIPPAIADHIVSVPPKNN